MFDRPLPQWAELARAHCCFFVREFHDTAGSKGFVVKNTMRLYLL
jgi:hypothetical protein